MMTKYSGALIHDEIRRSYRLVLVDDELIIVQSTARNHFREDLLPG